jgi:hypothetical protein
MARQLSDREIDEIMTKANDLIGIGDQLQPLHRTQVNGILTRAIYQPDSLTKSDLSYIRRTWDFYRGLINPF